MPTLGTAIPRGRNEHADPRHDHSQGVGTSMPSPGKSLRKVRRRLVLLVGVSILSMPRALPVALPTRIRQRQRGGQATPGTSPRS